MKNNEITNSVNKKNCYQRVLMVYKDLIKERNNNNL